MTRQIPSGIPNLSDYESAKASALFKRLEDFSDNFLKENPVVQASYGWVADPLHQWSRLYEYPYVFGALLDELRKRDSDGIDILDAGSGATFFPFLLREELQQGSVTCCDYDASLEPIFAEVNAKRERGVTFRQADLRRLPFDDASFDLIYCVSVLEHTDQYEDIVSEFNRVLRPGGVLIATFDIGLDGVSDIPPRAADRLNACIEKILGKSDLGEDAFSVMPDSITSREIGSRNPELLPWRFPFLSFLKAAWRRKALPGSTGKNLTVLCARYFKS